MNGLPPEQFFSKLNVIKKEGGFNFCSKNEFKKSKQVMLEVDKPLEYVILQNTNFELGKDLVRAVMSEVT